MTHEPTETLVGMSLCNTNKLNRNTRMSLDQLQDTQNWIAKANDFLDYVDESYPKSPKLAQAHHGSTLSTATVDSLCHRGVVLGVWWMFLLPSLQRYRRQQLKHTNNF